MQYRTTGEKGNERRQNKNADIGDEREKKYAETRTIKNVEMKSRRSKKKKTGRGKECGGS